MKILFHHRTRGQGAEGAHIRGVVKGLTQLGHQVEILSLPGAENGAWPMDNDYAENCIRPFVVGRKNWLFSTSVEGAKASANLYSLVESV